MVDTVRHPMATRVRRQRQGRRDRGTSRRRCRRRTVLLLMVERGWSDEYLAVGMQLMEQTSTGTRAVQTLICQHRLPRIRDLL